MGKALRKTDVTDLMPPSRPLSDAEVQEIIDRLQLATVGPAVQSWIAHDEERRRRWANLLEARDAFYGDLRLTRDPHEAADNAGTIAGFFRKQEADLRQAYVVEEAEALRFRRQMERRSPQVRRVAIPIADRSLERLRAEIRHARNSAIESEALMSEAVLGNGWLRPAAEPLASGVIDVLLGTRFDQGLSPTERRRTMEGLAQLARYPRAPRFDLSPVAVAATMWAAWAGPQRIALLRREPGPQRDALIAVSIRDFEPVAGDGPSSLSDGVAWALRGGRMEIAAPGKETIESWLAALSGSGAPGELFGGDVGEETVEW